MNSRILSALLQEIEDKDIIPESFWLKLEAYFNFSASQRKGEEEEEKDQFNIYDLLSGSLSLIESQSFK